MMYWSRSLKTLLILFISYDSFAAEKISTNLNEIQDLNRNTADQCDSLNKLNDIVGSQSEIIPGWTNDGLDAGPWRLPKWDYVWEVCGKDEAWYGWKLNSGVGSISTILTASGSAELSFGNCWASGTVKVYLDDIEIASAGPVEHKTVAFDFQTGAVLSIRDEGANSIIQISKFEILSCDVASSSILVMGGAQWSTGEFDLSPEVINLEGKTCSLLPEKYPKNVYSAVGAFINDQVVICGGWVNPSQNWWENNIYTSEYVEECYTLKKGSTTWTLLGNLNFVDSCSSSVVINNILYVIGGCSAYSATGLVDGTCTTIESISLDGTTTVENITINGNLHPIDDDSWRYCLTYEASVTINSTTSISIGGTDYGLDHPEENLEKTLYYNGETFSEGPDLITGRFDGHAAGLLRDKDTNEEYIAVVGGSDIIYPVVEVLDSLELLKIGDNKWKLGNPLPLKLRDHSIVTIGGDIIVIGGRTTEIWDLGEFGKYEYIGKEQSALYKLSCKSGNCQWTTLPQSLEIARSHMLAIPIPDDFFDCN